MDKQHATELFAEKATNRWFRLAKAWKVVPLLGEVRKADALSQAYHCRFAGATRVPLPKHLIEKTHNKDIRCNIRVNATLFHLKTFTFFGSTFHGPEIDFHKCSKAVSPGVYDFTFGDDYGFLFHTAVDLTETKLVCEIVMTLSEAGDGIRGEEYTVCWTPANPEPKRDAEKFSVTRNEKDILPHQLYAGTPRLLLFVGGGGGATAVQLPGYLQKAKQAGAWLMCVVMTHKKMQDVAVAVLSENELVGGTDPVLSATPGLIGHMLGSGAQYVNLTKKCPIILKNLKVTFADKMEERLHRFVFARSGKRIEVKGYVAEVGVHNGRKFLGPVRRLDLTKTGTEVSTEEAVVLKDYVANDMIAVVWLVFVQVEMEGVASRICIGWLPIVATQSHGDKGPILIGEYSLPMKCANPMMAVSNAIVYSDREAAGKSIKDRSHELRLSVVLNKDAKSDPGVRTVPLKSRVDAAAASGEFQVPDSEGASQSGGAGTASERDSVPRRQPNAAQEAGGPAEEGTLSTGDPTEREQDADEEEKETISLLCNCKLVNVDGSSEIVEVEYMEDEFLDDMKFQELLDKLEEKFDVDLYAFEYKPRGGGEVVVVEDEETFEEFLDMIEADLEGDDTMEGRFPITLIPDDEEDESEREEGGKAEKKVEGAVKKAEEKKEEEAEVKVEEKKGGGGGGGGGRRGSEASSSRPSRRGEVSTEGEGVDELREIKLNCQKQQVTGVRGVHTLTLSVDAGWAQVRRALREAVKTDCLLEYVNLAGDALRVDSEDTWDALANEILDDWETENQLDGEMDVDLIPDPTSSKPARAPSGGETIVGKPPSRRASASSQGPAKSPSRPSSRRASQVIGTPEQLPTDLPPKPSQGSRRSSESKEAPLLPKRQIADAKRQSQDAKRQSADAKRQGGPSSSGKPPRAKKRDGEENRHPHAARKSADQVPKLPRSSAAGSQAVSTDGSDLESARDTPGRRTGTRRRRVPTGLGGHQAVDEKFEYVEDDEEVLHCFYRGPGSGSRAPLSRALKAQLFTTSIRDLVPSYEKDVPLVEVPLPTSAIDLGKEAADRLQRHTIILHIVAVSLPTTASAVYFSTRFYHFEPLKTVPAKILPPLGEEDVKGPSMLKVEGTPADATGVTIRFSVDALESTKAGDEYNLHFARYLAASTLLVDIWDSDTALPIGSMQLELRQLLRQGREAVQTAGDYPILDTSLSPPHPSGALRMSADLYAHADAKPVGRAFVRFVNVGEESTAQTWTSASVRNSMERVNDHEALGLRASRTGSPTKIERVVPLIDAAYGARSSMEGGKPVSSSRGPDRGLALLCANKAAVARAVRSAGASTDALTVDTLQKCLVGLRLELSARQVTAACLHLAEHCGGDGHIDLSKVHMVGEEMVSRSTVDEATKDVLLDRALLLLGGITTRYGSAQAAADKFGSAPRLLHLHAFQGMAEALKEVMASPMSSDEVKTLLEIISGGGGSAAGVTFAKFEEFFSVKVKGAVKKEEKEGDAAARGDGSTVDRKLERWERMKAKRGTERGAQAAEKQMLIDAAREMREAHKTHKIQEFLESSITTTEHIYPAYGELCYLQYTLRNPYSEDRVIAVRFDDDALELVTDANEWRTLNQVFGMAGLVEEDMMAKDSKGCTIWMQGHQQISLPFKYRTLTPGIAQRSNHPGGKLTRPLLEGAVVDASADKGRLITVQMLSGKQGGNMLPLYILNINVNPRPYVVDQVFRFRQGAHDFLKKKILVDLGRATFPHEGWRQGGTGAGLLGRQQRESPKHVWCSDSNVIVGSSPHLGEGRMQEVHVKYRCGGAGTVTSFFIVLYNDAAHASVFEVWEVHVYAMNRLDLQGLVGQTERQGCSITLRSKDGARSVKVVSSHPDELVPDVGNTGGIFQLGENLTEVPFKYQPMVAGRREVIVNFLDASQPAASMGAAPLATWLVTARANPPLVAKRYDIGLAINKAASKKILYTNPYSAARKFRLKTNRPDLLTFREPSQELAIAGKGSQYMGLKFSARRQGGSEEVLLFINDEEDKNLECLCIAVYYA